MVLGVCGSRFTHGHICDVVPAKKADYETIEIIACFFGPIILILLGLILSIFIVYFLLKREEQESGVNSNSFFNKHKKLIFFFAFIFGLLMNYLFLIITIYVCSFMVVGRIHKKLEEKQVIRFLLGTLLVPFMIIFLLI